MSDIVTRVKSRMTAQHIKPDKIKTIKTRALSEVIDDFQGQARASGTEDGAVDEIQLPFV